MAKWGKCDFKQLERLNKNMEKLMDADLDKFCQDAAKDLASRLLQKVVKRTPVDTGALKDAWIATKVGHRGIHYTVVVLNNLQYAVYVEYGHRQVVRVREGSDENGKAVYGKKYTGFVPGRYMLTISTQELEQQAPKLLEKKLYLFLKGCFDA